MSGRIPLYSRIKGAIRRQVEDGSLAPGDRAPSERELAERYGVSRMTARHALSELAHEGMLVRLQGQGTFVADRKVEHSVSELVGFSEDMRRRGLLPGSATLAVERIRPSLALATALAIDLGEPVVRIERIRYAARKPMSHETSYLPAERVPGIEERDLDGSLYELLRDAYGVTLARAEQRIEGLKADEREAELLGIDVGDVLLRLERTSWDAERPVEFVRALYRADRYVFLSSLAARPD